MIWFTEETTASVLEALSETAAVAEEVASDLEQLKPNVLLETVKSWIPGIAAFGYRVIAAIIIFFIGSRIIHFICKAFTKMLTKIDVEITVRRFLNSVLKVSLYCILVFIAADKIGINSASIIALLGSAGLAIGLSLQGSLANFAGGVLIMFMKPFKVGDYIVTSAGEGVVTNIGLVYTTINTIDNKAIVVPNGSLSNSPLTNVTAREKRRVDITVGISYSSDIKLAKDIIVKVYENNPQIIVKDGITTYVDSLGDSSVVLGGRGWVMTSDYWSARWSILETIKLEFDKAGIEIPFNQIDINIKK